MNALNERITKAVATRDFSHLDLVQFAYMDGYPTDFPPRTSDRCQVLVAAFGASRSLTLRSPHDTMLLNSLLLVPWKKSDDVYKAAFAEAIRTGSVREPVKAFILIYQPTHLYRVERALWEKHFGPSGEPDPKYVVSYVDGSGQRMLRFPFCIDDRNPKKPKPICMSRDQFTTMLLWSEFIIKVFEEVEYSVYTIGEKYDGLVVFSNMISGDSEQNGDRCARVLRSALEGAYKDRITCVNYKKEAQDSHVGEMLADNVAGCVGAALRDTGKPFLDERGNRLLFRYLGLDDKADLVPWPRAQGLCAS